MRNFCGILALVFVLFSAPPLCRGEELTVLTTVWTPYAYEENGKITGLGTELVRAILNRANFSGQIRISSWNRAIISAKDRKNVLIYPLMRINERENDFTWVCPLFNAELSLFKLAKNKNIVVNNLSDAKNYTIGVLKGAAMHRFLLSNGFEDNRQLQIFYANRKSIELLFRGRIDLVADNPLVVSYEVKQLARSGIKDITFSTDQLQELVPLTRKKAYLAFGKDSSPQFVDRLRKAWTELEADGTSARISAKYE